VRKSQYTYQANSNLVLQAEREGGPRSNEPTGEVRLGGGEGVVPAYDNLPCGHPRPPPPQQLPLRPSHGQDFPAGPNVSPSACCP
jgi:hypothetical protein